MVEFLLSAALGVILGVVFLTVVFLLGAVISDDETDN